MKQLKPKRAIFFIRGLIALLRTRFITHRPFLLSHLVTSRCNCHCPICLWRGYTEEELSTDQVLSIYEEAWDNGFAALVLWGGEPLVRDDIAQIAKEAHEMGFVTLLITNGYRLEEIAPELCPNLDALIVSMDFPSEKHDLFRGYPGLFRKAVRGIHEAKRVNPRMKISINCVITKLNGRYVGGMISLADQLGVSITFESMNTHMPFSIRNASPFKLPPEEESEIFKQIRRYKLRGHKINNSLAYLDTFIGGKSRYECHSLEICLTLQPNGDVRICLSREPIANLTETPIGEVLRIILAIPSDLLIYSCGVKPAETQRTESLWLTTQVDTSSTIPLKRRSLRCVRQPSIWMRRKWPGMSSGWSRGRMGYGWRRSLRSRSLSPAASATSIS